MMKKKVERNYGIDLLRILSMFFVVVLHVLGQGGLLESTSGINNKIVWLLEVFAFCAVNCYGLISGYVGVKNKYRLSNVLHIWIQVFLYNFIVYFVFLLLGKIEFNFEVLKEMLFPVLTERYWYFTAYFGLFFLIPVLNFLLEKFPKRKMFYVLICYFVLFSLCPMFINKDMFHMNNGYSLYWLIYLYLIGGYISKYNIFNGIKRSVLIIVYVLVCIFSWLSKFGFVFLSRYFSFAFDYQYVFISYTSPTILIAGICLLLLFSTLDVSKLKETIMFLSPISFGVYLIHTQPLIFDTLFAGMFSSFADLNAVVLVLVVFIIGVIIYLLCSLVDYLRVELFNLFKIKERLFLIEEKYFKDVI